MEIGRCGNCYAELAVSSKRLWDDDDEAYLCVVRGNAVTDRALARAGNTCRRVNDDALPG